MNAKKILKITVITLASVICLFVMIAGGYVAYVAAQYYRIEDNLKLGVSDGATRSAAAGETFTVMTYNLGFGAYSPEYSFFMDTGVMKDGTEVTGKYAKGTSREDVRKNVDGQLSVAKAAAISAFGGYSAVYAENFHTARLFYPLSDPIGKTNAGLLTLSALKVGSAVRRSFPVTDNFIDKLFDLDRCFSVHYVPVEHSEAQLVMINLHMSAYDKGGTVRASQLEMLNAVLAEEYAKGNFVVAGGDFNHCLIADAFDSDEEALTHFESEQKVPEWVKNSVLRSAELAQAFTLAADADTATCRAAEMPYTKGVNYTTTVEGFIVSDNVEVVSVSTVDTEYAYSDHNPVVLEFRLKNET